MIHKILKRTSYHAVYDQSVTAALRYAQENGFGGVQLADETMHLSFERLSEQDIVQINELTESTGLAVSLHAPDETTSLFTPSQILREGIHAYYRAFFAFACAVRARVVSIHIGSRIPFPTDTIPERKHPENDLTICEDIVRRSFEFLVEEASDQFALCIENYRLDSLTLELLQPYVSDGRLSLCWDIAKSHNSPKLQEYFWSNLDSVKQVHLHDIRVIEGRVRSHRVIGTGEIDFASYLRRMKDAEILDYCIEVRPREKAVESLNALREILRTIEKTAEQGAPHGRGTAGAAPRQ